jgi:hypothetical protein
MKIKKAIIGEGAFLGAPLITFTNVILYKGPNISSKIVSKLADTSNLVKIINGRNGWVKVGNTLNGQVGWVFKDHSISINKKSKHLSKMVDHLDVLESHFFGGKFV